MALKNFRPYIVPNLTHSLTLLLVGRRRRAVGGERLRHRLTPRRRPPSAAPAASHVPGPAAPGAAAAAASSALGRRLRLRFSGLLRGLVNPAVVVAVCKKKTTRTYDFFYGKVRGVFFYPSSPHVRHGGGGRRWRCHVK